MPDYNYHYEIPEADLEVDALQPTLMYPDAGEQLK